MSPKTKRRILLSTAVLLVLTALLWWARSGPSELDRYKAQLIAQGEILDLDKLAPKRTGKEPDGDVPLNDAALQISNRIQFRTDRFLPSVNSNNLLSVTWSTHPAATNQTQRTALWLQAEAEVENRRSELVAASLLLQNPPREKGAEYRDLPNYPRGNFAQRRDVAMFFSSALLADSHAGRSAQAATNLTALLDLCDFQREEWTYLNQMIRIPIARLTLNTVQYGLLTHTWSEPDLARFQGRLESLSLVTNTYQSLLYLRAQGESIFVESRTNAPLVITNMFPGPTGLKEYLLGGYYKANMDKDELTFLQFSQSRLDFFRQQLRSPAWAGAPALLQAQAEATFDESDSWMPVKGLWLSSLLSPNLSQAIGSLAVAETIRLQTITAIALERHRLKHGQYPDALAKLIPDYLDKVPQDPMDSRPMRYRLNTDGTFTLWSVGFDGKDGGGDFSLPDPKKQSTQDARDLVWPRLDPIDLPP